MNYLLIIIFFTIIAIIIFCDFKYLIIPNKLVFLLILTGLIGLLINLIVIKLFVTYVGLWYIYAKLIAIAVGFIWNYLGNRHITFNFFK